MIVSDFCEREVVIVEADTTLVETAKLMRHFHAGYVVVVEDKNNQINPLGIVTDRDIVIEVVATELDAETITAGDIMVQYLYKVSKDDGLVSTIEMMNQHGVRRLPVVTAEGLLVGVVTMENILEKMSNLFDFTALIKTERENEFKQRQ